MYVAFFAVAAAGSSFGSKLKVTTVNSLPASNGKARSMLTTPFSTSVHSIGHV